MGIVVTLSNTQKKIKHILQNYTMSVWNVKKKTKKTKQNSKKKKEREE